MSRRPIIPTLAMIVVALTVAAVAFASWHPPRQSREPHLVFASNHLVLTQTSPNQALIRLPNARPGQMARGTTRLTVTGLRANLAVRAANLVDVAGANAGKLIASKRLWIDVRCVAHPCPRPPVAYRGPLADMGTRSLGSWPAGAPRTYLVRVWLVNGARPPSNTTGDNVFQGSQARFGLIWTATAT